MDKSKIFKAIYVLSPRQIKERVIVSPIIYPKEYGRINKEEVKVHRSMLGYFTANFKNLTWIKTPMTQGGVYDAVMFLGQTKCKEIIFLGAIGGLISGQKIGDIIISTNARDVYSVGSISEEEIKFLITLKKKGYLGIDFESQLFFKAAQKRRLSAHAFYVISDLLFKKPFYLKKSQLEKERIQAAINKILKKRFNNCSLNLKMLK